MVILRCLWAFYQRLENIMVISMESTDQIFHLSTFSDSNSFMTVGPGLCWLQVGGAGVGRVVGDVDPDHAGAGGRPDHPLRH